MGPKEWQEELIWNSKLSEIFPVIRPDFAQYKDT